MTKPVNGSKADLADAACSDKLPLFPVKIRRGQNQLVNPNQQDFNPDQGQISYQRVFETPAKPRSVPSGVFFWRPRAGLTERNGPGMLVRIGMMRAEQAREANVGTAQTACESL